MRKTMEQRTVIEVEGKITRVSIEGGKIEIFSIPEYLQNPEGNDQEEIKGTQEYIEKYSYGCAVLSRCIELHSIENVTWEKLAEAVRRLSAKYKSCLPKSAAGLRRKAHNYINNGAACLVSLKFGNSNASKL